jgi:biopolymer transport protein ExbD
MAIRRARRLNASIDMTPMIDCVFQLLIFFMLSSALIGPQFQLQLPESDTKEAPENSPIILSADAQGRFHINQEVVELTQIPERLRPLLAKSAIKTVTFRGDKKIDFQQFVKAFDAVRASGAKAMNIVHE